MDRVIIHLTLSLNRIKACENRCLTRFVNREVVSFRLDVLTPMFLGDADGNAKLRAAPFKNAIRYWWRITQGDIPHEELLRKEKSLFGGVEGGPKRSLVQIEVSGDAQCREVGQSDDLGIKCNREANNRDVPLSAYLGMGPVDFYEKYTKKSFLPGQSFGLTVSFPKEQRDQLIDTLSLFKSFGTLGARSRNGWGSFGLHVENGDIVLLSTTELFSKFGQEISAIFKRGKQYPFRLGVSNGRPLLWKIRINENWQGAMKIAGEKYMELRQIDLLTFPHKKPSGVQKRHILGYPLTNHRVKAWGE